MNTQVVEDYLLKLDFSHESARLYAVLSVKGPLTILEASRATGIERTALYRLVETLVANGLIEEVLAYKSRKIRAADPTQIRLILQEKQKRVQDLSESFPAFERAAIQAKSLQATQVRYFRGTEGIKQILWNETRARGTVVGYTHRNLEEVVGVAYFRKYARELERKHIQFRDLRTDTFLSSIREQGYTANPIEGDTWPYLPDSVLRLTHGMDIYDDVVAIYYWEDNDVFGVEIQNEKIADTQRSIFEALWVLAESYPLPTKIDQGNLSNYEMKLGLTGYSGKKKGASK